MITKFKDFSGIISVNMDGNIMYFKLKFDDNEFPIDIDLYVNDNKYGKLSIIIPDSNKLERKEFFINPDINDKIVDALKKENFIQETNKKSIAGDKEVKSYVLSI